MSTGYLIIDDVRETLGDTSKEFRNYFYRARSKRRKNDIRSKGGACQEAFVEL